MSHPVIVRQIPAKRGFAPREAAEYLGVSRHTLNKLVDEGELTARAMGRGRRFLLEDLDAFLDSLPRYARGGPDQKGDTNGR